MNILEFAKGELQGWGKYERIIFPLEILLITLIAIYMKDKTAALISAICGICATITAGKGKISCYMFGMISNICYSYISFKNAFWGNLCLNMLYYFPMQFVGISKWKKHMKKDKQEIYKTSLSLKERGIYFGTAFVCSVAGYFILKYFGDSNPLMDSVTTVLSVIAFILTVKRCIEQWYLWTVVNGLCVIMWIGAYLNGSHCFATILMWSTYFALGLYFLYNWRKEIKIGYNTDVKKFIIIIILSFICQGYAFANDLEEVDLNAPALKINTQTQKDVLTPHPLDINKNNSQNNAKNYGKYNPDGAYRKKTTSFKKEKRFKKVDIGAQYDTTFTPDNASQTRTLYTKMHLNDKASINTSYSTNTNSQSNNPAQMNGTISITPEYRFNPHLSVQNKFSRNTSNGMSKEEIDIKVNPFRDTDRLDLNAGVGQVQYTNGSPSSSQINFGADFKF